MPSPASRTHDPLAPLSHFSPTASKPLYAVRSGPWLHRTKAARETRVDLDPQTSQPHISNLGVTRIAGEKPLPSPSGMGSNTPLLIVRAFAYTLNP